MPLALGLALDLAPQKSRLGVLLDHIAAGAPPTSSRRSPPPAASYPDKAGAVTAIPVLLARLAENDGLRGALVLIGAIAANATAISRTPGLHWVLGVTIGGDQSRLRKGHGARNMATVRRFALNLVRAAKDKRSIRPRRKLATRTPAYLEHPLNAETE